MKRPGRRSPLSFLASTPWRSRESRLPGRRRIRPYQYWAAVLPLDGDRLVTDLVAPLVDREVTEDGLGLEFQDFSTNKVRVQAAGAPPRVQIRRAAVRG